MAVEITDGNFSDVVLNSDKAVLVDFWATWCGPCRMIAPIVDELHTELEGKAVIGKVNVDENSESSANYGVRNIPTILIVKKKHYQFSKVALHTFNVLEENKIAFEDFNKAKIHITKHWKEIDTWWKPLEFEKYLSELGDKEK